MATNLKNAGWMIALAIAVPIQARATDDIAACRAVKDPSERLACFDRTAAPRPASDAQKMDINDYLLDAKQLTGKRVAVQGVLQVVAGFVVLKKDISGADFAFVQVDNVPRAQRKAMLQCRAGCEATVRGIARPVFGKNDIIADEIEIVGN